MNCTTCSKEITSKLTGELCATCYFTRKKTDENIKEFQRTSDIIPSVQLNYPDISSSTDSVKPILKIEDPPIIEPKVIQFNSVTTNKPDPKKKYCQSCLERGYGLALATREWKKDYFICDDCFRPLMDNIMQVDRKETDSIIGKINTDSPAYNQVCDLLEVPNHLRFSSEDTFLRSRNDIFNYHATALVNLSLEDITSRMEEMRLMLFQIKEKSSAYADYINKVKHEERERQGINKLQESKKEFSKGPSKIKMSKDEKLAKTLGFNSYKEYQEAVKLAKEKTFDKIVGKS